ncbi:hypothetical protein AAEX28_01440 [Lentisphaerota bacterium WC36G]|nr:hypothetical protein LJT99_04325 [Lentisphaerae bacterium WC36]
MLYFEGDFAQNTNSVLEAIKNLCEDVTITMDPKGFDLDGESLKFYLSDMSDLKRFQIYLQKYFNAINNRLFKRTVQTQYDPDTGRLRRVIAAPKDLMLDDFVQDPDVDYAGANLQTYITALKNSTRYDELTKTLDHISPKSLYKKLCMFRFLYKYYFPIGLQPMAVDRFYNMFKDAFCPNEKPDSEGLVDAIYYVTKLYHIELAKNDMLVKTLRADSQKIASLRLQRESLCKAVLESENELSSKGQIFQEYSQMMLRRDSYARDILEGIATIYAHGFEKTCEDYPNLRNILRMVKEENRDIRAHGQRNFEQIFSPLYFSFDRDGQCCLTDYYRPQDFFLIMQHILTRCNSLRRQWGTNCMGRFKRWMHDFQFGKLAEAFINILNRSMMNLAHPTRGHDFSFFREGHFRDTPYQILAHCYDRHDEYRRAFQIVVDLENEYHSARDSVGAASHRVVVLDGELNRTISRLERNLYEFALEISSRYQMQLRNKVIRRLSMKKESFSKPPKLPPRNYARKRSVHFSTSSDDSIRSPLSRQNSVFYDPERSLTPGLRKGSTFSDPESSLPLGPRRTSAFALRRGASSISQDPSHNEPIPEEIDEDYEFAQHFTGEDEDDFATAVRLIMADNGNYAKLINLRQKLFRTHLAREIKISDHMLWTGSERRHCTRYWGHIERIIQILALTDMITRNLSLSKITRITNHYFFLITDRHPNILIKKNRKKVCGMAKRYFENLRKNPQNREKALDMLEDKWNRYVSLYNLTPMNKLEVLQAGRGGIGRDALLSIDEDTDGKAEV